jgi:hypothetical protein
MRIVLIKIDSYRTHAYDFENLLHGVAGCYGKPRIGGIAGPG